MLQKNRDYKIGAFSDVLVHSKFSDSLFNNNLDATCGIHRNIFLGHKKAVCKLSVPDAGLGDNGFSFSWKFSWKVWAINTLFMTIVSIIKAVIFFC